MQFCLQVDNPYSLQSVGRTSRLAPPTGLLGATARLVLRPSQRCTLYLFIYYVNLNYIFFISLIITYVFHAFEIHVNSL